MSSCLCPLLWTSCSTYLLRKIKFRNLQVEDCTVIHSLDWLLDGFILVWITQMIFTCEYNLMPGAYLHITKIRFTCLVVSLGKGLICRVECIILINTSISASSNNWSFQQEFLAHQTIFILSLFKFRHTP